VQRIASAVLVVVLLIAILPPRAAGQVTEADVYVAQAILDFDDRRYDEAIANLTKALEIEPDHVEALYYMGVVRVAQERPADAVPFLERARAAAPASAAVVLQLGLAYFAQQDYDRAQPLLEQAFAADPLQDGLGYYVGFMRYRQRDYRRALSAFRAGRTTSPELRQLTRLYTGLTLAMLGLPAQAAAEVDESLRLAPGTPLTGPAERLRDAVLAARDRQKRFSAELRLGVFFDDNVAVVPSRDRADPIVPILRDRKHESTGELFGTRLGYIWYRADALDATVGYSFFGTYNNDLPSFNVTDHVGMLGATYRGALGAMPLQLTGQYAFDALFLDDRAFLQRHTLTMAGALVQTDMHLTQLFARFQDKDFKNQAIPLRREARDARNYMLGAVHLLRFAEDRHFLKLGYQWDLDAAVGAHYRYHGHRVSLGARYTLPWKDIRLSYDFDVHLRDYTDRHSLLPTPRPGTRVRRDEEMTNIVRADVPLPYRFTLSAEFQATINRSNIAAFDYTRNVVSLILSWVY
jgi:tetratricopeptide (TPR) repeat protein